MSYSSRPMKEYDKNTRYSIEATPLGFDITILYSRYQFIPESDAVAFSCKQAVTSIAWDQAERESREIQVINEQRIRVSMGRNGLTGITTCSASAKVQWK